MQCPMKKKTAMYHAIVPAIMLLPLLVWDASFARAQQPVVVPMGQKFLRGAANLTTGWAEVPKQIYLKTAAGHPVIGPLWGLFDGIGMAFVRVSAGVYETSSFLLPLPRQYEPVLQPAYVWEK